MSAEPIDHDAGERRALKEEPRLVDDYSDMRVPPGKTNAALWRAIDLQKGTGDLTELANAERLVALHGDRLRFAVGLGWLAWDGRRWAPGIAIAAELAKDALRVLLQDAHAEQRPKGGAKAGDARVRFAERSQSARGIAAMLRLAESDPRVRIESSQLDADPYLLNAVNGTIDLRTGVRRDHAPGDFITKLSPVAYDPEAPMEDWLKFLETATRGDAPMIAYLKSAAGYSLTGETSQEKLFFVHGPSGSAKSTFVDAIRSVLGDYAMVTAFDTFAQRGHVEAQRPDVARLMGARMVSAAEVGAERRLDEAMISAVTGGDTMHACHKYKDPFEFKPRLKLWLVANKRPRVNDMEDETGIWRRLHCIPFDHKIPKDQRDPDVKARFTDPGRGGLAVLRWAVEGARAYLEARKLVEPARIEEATEAYRAENDPIRDFVAACLVVVPGGEAFIFKSKLRDLYEKWARDEGVKVILDAKAIAKRLRGKPYACEEGKRRPSASATPIAVWYGIRERKAADDADDAGDEPAADLH